MPPEIWRAVPVRFARFARRQGGFFGLGLGVWLVGCLLSSAPAAEPGTARLEAVKHPSPQQEAFFELKVRPLLAARCFRCHGEKEQKGGIRLDSAEALLGKSDDEALLKPGRPNESRLMEVVSYKEEPKMPPDGRLPDADVQILRAWIRRGAHFPSKESAAAPVRLSSPEGIVRARRTMWSLQPVQSPVPPRVTNSAWAKTAIDLFILARLQEKRLSPSPAVDRAHAAPPAVVRSDRFAADI